jgi:tetratricopeptide (TPR) repeat protein
MGPHFAQAYMSLATFYESNKQFARAEEVLQRGVENNPDNSSLYISWAELLYAEQKTGLGENVLRRLSERQSKSAGVALTIGNFYLMHVGVDKALAEYRRGLAIDSHNTEIKDQIVQCYLATGRLKEATALNNEVLKQNPKDVSGGISRARILLGDGRIQDAILVLRNLLKRSPDLTAAHYLVGLAYWQNQDFGQAKNEFQETLRQAPGLLAAEHSLAELDMVLGQPQPAFELAQAIVQKHPNQPAERILLGTAYLRLGQLSQGEEQFVIARQMAPADPSVAFDLAVAYRANRKFAEAEREFEAALKLNPQFVQAIDGLASLWIARNERPKAISRAEQYVATNPDDPIGHLILGSLRADDRRYDDAKKEFERAAQLKPTLVMAQTRLGDTYRALGNMPEAIRAYERATTLQPGSATLHTLLGNLYDQQNNKELAEKQYQAALTADPNDGMAANNLAWMYLKDGGNLDVALGLAQKAKETAPDVVNLTDTLGWIQYKKGLYAGAVSLLEDCVAKAPQSPVYRYHLGMALLASGDVQTAKNQLETALRLNLKGDDAEQARKAVNHLN